MAVRDSSERARKRKDDVLTAVLCAPGIGARESHPFRVNYRIFTSTPECPGFACREIAHTCVRYTHTHTRVVVPIDLNFVVKVAWKVVPRARVAE